MATSTTPILNNITTTTLLANSLVLKKPSSLFSLPLLSPHAPPHRFRVTRVSTAPVEYAPSPSPDFNLHEEISRLRSLRSNLASCRTLREKLRVINSDSRVKSFFLGDSDGFSRFGLSSEELYLFKCLVAAGQEHVVRSGIEVLGRSEEGEGSARGVMKSALYKLVEMIENFDAGSRRKSGGVGLDDDDDEASANLKGLLKTLAEIERFYDCIGGIIGYQVTVLELLAESTAVRHTINWSKNIQKSEECQFLEVHPPSGLDLSQNTDYASQAALWGIEGLPDLGEIYPLGGSADRLGLVDPETGECLPAAMLPYCGRTLLEGLIRDLQAREFLYFKLHGSQCITPVAIMTSSAKNNHKRITTLCERLQWFGRGQSSFKLFEQPLVPAVSMEGGHWLVNKPFRPLCKPGGHGVIWKLAYDNGVFDWFYDHGRKGATVRQVSNVVAATDLTLLALAGIGLHHGKKLGFASCKRNSGATEGINVLMEKKNLDGMWAYGLSCIEYTEFDKFGVGNGPISSNGFQAEFPANTNILYVDLHSAESVGSSKNKNSLPGMVLNVKKQIEYVDHFGRWQSVRGGRLECTMQNIADNFLNTYPARRYKDVEDQLDTYIVYNERRRVTSSAKKKRRYTDKSLHQTPDGSLLDIMRNAYDLLSQCNIELSKVETNDKYIDSGPPFLIFLHPALGPLWEVSRQKFCGGSISKGSELQVEIAEFLWKNVQLDGSMVILAENVLGSTRINENGEPILQYGHRCSRCKLQNVKVLNAGIDWNNGDNTYWKNDVNRFEVLKVILHGNAEFEACNVRIQGNHVFEVPDGYRLKITQGNPGNMLIHESDTSAKNPGLAVQLDPIEQNMTDTGSWYWEYKKVGTHIKLELVEL